MLALVLGLALAQSGARSPVAVVQTSKRPGADQAAVKITQRVLEALKREEVGELMDTARATKALKVAGFSDPRSCQGTRSCLSKLAVLLGAHAVVVGVDVGKIGKTLAIHLEAVAADQDTPLTSLDVSSSLDGWSDAMSAPIVVFAREVKAGTEPPPPPPQPPPSTQSDVPVAVTVAPTTTNPGPDLTQPAPQARSSRLPAWLVTGGAVATAGVGVTFAVLGLGAKSRYDAALVTLPDGSRGTSLTQSEAQRLASATNTDFTVGLISGLVSVGLTATAIWLFTRD